MAQKGYKSSPNYLVPVWVKNALPALPKEQQPCELYPPSNVKRH